MSKLFEDRSSECQVFMNTTFCFIQVEYSQIKAALIHQHDIKTGYIVLLEFTK